MKKLLPIFILVFVVLGCKSVTSDNKNTNTSNRVESSQAKVNTWNYVEKTDEMTSKPIKTASIDSSNVLNFDFPYQGGSVGTLIVRRKDGKDEVVIVISKGQFLSGASNSPNVRLRFDEKEPFIVYSSEPTDHSSTIRFLSDEEKIINELRTSSSLKIEMGFYKEGNRILEFNVRDFKW